MREFARSGERGGARLKFLIVMVILAAVAWCGYLYVPVAYNAYLFKDLMQSKVDTAAGMGHPPKWLTDQLIKSAPAFDVPPDALITPMLENDRMKVRVQFNKAIQFPGYTYIYQFDHTANSTDFLGKSTR